jgi:hypothetical protein
VRGGAGLSLRRRRRERGIASSVRMRDAVGLAALAVAASPARSFGAHVAL